MGGAATAATEAVGDMSVCMNASTSATGMEKGGAAESVRTSASAEPVDVCKQERERGAGDKGE